ncbi:hypothetical protein D3C71_1903700 [compost metagenome]
MAAFVNGGDFRRLLGSGDLYCTLVGFSYLIADKRFLLIHECLHITAALLDGEQHALIHRGQHWAFHNFWQSVDHAAAQLGTDQGLALVGQEVAAFQFFDD